jgi:retron-type reverse transcriptase
MKTDKFFYKFDQSPFYMLRSKKRLARLLQLERAELISALDIGIKYNEWDEQKSNGRGIRHIENPSPSLKKIQRIIAKKLSKIEPPGFLICPVKGRSFAHNAKIHAGAKMIRTLDIKNYFPSTSSKRVFWFWHKRMHCESNLAGILTVLSCLNGHLPTGSPLSPILSFYSHIDIWEEINAVAAKNGCKVTIYIDDITISGSNVSDDLVWQIKKLIDKAGLEYHKEKTFRSNWGEVTGLIVKNGQVKIPNRTLKEMHLLRRAIRVEKDVHARKAMVKRLKSYAIHEQHIKSMNCDTGKI